MWVHTEAGEGLRTCAGGVKLEHHPRLDTITTKAAIRVALLLALLLVTGSDIRVHMYTVRKSPGAIGGKMEAMGCS